MCRKTEKLKRAFSVYFVGIGGISMSALAIYLHDMGFCVCGYDKTEGQTVKILKQKGIAVNQIGLLENCDLAVVSSAIDNENEQIKKLRRLNKPIISRALLLSEIASTYDKVIGVAGTHGKTTATCLIAHILKSAQMPVNAHIGGLDSVFGNVITDDLKNKNSLFLSEVCEYKQNLKFFNPTVAVILNVDDDHLESYGSFDKLKEEFKSYAERSKLAVLNADDQFLNSLNGIKFSVKNKNSDYFAQIINKGQNCIEYAVYEYGAPLLTVKANSFFTHDVANGLASVACARALEINAESIKKGIENFKGVKRRGEVVAVINGCTIFADYAHHPSQVINVINEVVTDNTAVLFQSHTYSRTKGLFKQFVYALNRCKNLYIFDTYAAREKYDYYGSGEYLSEKLPHSVYCGSAKNCISVINSFNLKYDKIVILGAGNLYDFITENIKNIKL